MIRPVSRVGSVTDSDEIVSEEGRLSGRNVGESVCPTWSSMVSPEGKSQWLPHSSVPRVPEARSPASVAIRWSPRETSVLVPSGATSHSLYTTVASTPASA